MYCKYCRKAINRNSATGALEAAGRKACRNAPGKTHYPASGVDEIQHLIGQFF